MSFLTQLPPFFFFFFFELLISIHGCFFFHVFRWSEWTKEQRAKQIAEKQSGERERERERERETNKHKHSRLASNPEKERHQTLNPKKRKPCHRGQSVWLVCASAAQPRPNSCHTWPASPFLCQTQPKRYAFLPVKFCVPFLCCSQCLDSSAVLGVFFPFPSWCNYASLAPH